MKKLLVINDLHIGTLRIGGTTCESSNDLRKYLLRKFSRLLALGDNIVINGDFFDSPRVPMIDLLMSYQILSDWLGQGGKSICLIPGNHCLSKSTSELSSFELLSRLLQVRFSNSVRYLQGGSWVQDGVYAISHVHNQAKFDQELLKVPNEAKYLLLHCNYDSIHACEADHSLNISREQAKNLVANGTTLVLGHEHQSRILLGGSVVIVGNQFPSSVSDCLGMSQKFCLEITNKGTELIPTWSAYDCEGGFKRVDWRELDNAPKIDKVFVRVEGVAASDEAASVIKAISHYRQRARAFVITNAVRIEQVEGLSEVSASVDEIKALSILDLLMEQLDERQVEVIREVLKEEA